MRARARLAAVLCAAGLAASNAAAQKVIRMHAGGDFIDYTPTANMVKSPANPYPHDAIRRLADEWERLNPEYRLEFVSAPPPDLNYRAWAVTNFVGGTIPHVVYQNMGAFRDSDFTKGWVVAMDPYLKRPNRYVDGNERWADQFHKPWVDALRSLDGRLYWIAPDTVGVGILCNKKILAEAGVHEMPKTFGEFVAACHKVRDAGHLAYFSPYEWYINIVVPSVLWADRIPAMDLSGDRTVDLREFAIPISRGEFTATDERFMDYLRLFEELAACYPKGWTVLDAEHLFRNGRLAFMEGLSFHMKQLDEDERLTFEFEVIPYPDITREDSPFGGAPLAGAGNAGYTSTWQVTNAAVRDDVVEACVDWLMFLTAPENNEVLVNEVGFTLPGVKGAQPVPMFQELHEKAIAEIQKPDYLDWHTFSPVTYTNELSDNWKRTSDNLMLGVIDREEAARRTQFWIERSHKSLVRRHGKEWGLEEE